MKKEEVKVKDYLCEAAAELGMELLLTRTSNALVRDGIDTMEKLCAMDEENLVRVRNMGEKCRGFALMARARYQRNNN
jgi:DNA-directed RNA polymerase alpha subunit